MIVGTLLTAEKIFGLKITDTRAPVSWVPRTFRFGLILFWRFGDFLLGRSRTVAEFGHKKTS